MLYSNTAFMCIKEALRFLLINIKQAFTVLQKRKDDKVPLYVALIITKENTPKWMQFRNSQLLIIACFLTFH